MIKDKKQIINFKYFFFIFLVLTYIIGFFLRENIAGGAELDFINFTWPAILAFKSNFFETLKNYYTIGEGSPPLFHILNAYLNPFLFSEIAFQGSITLLSFLNILFFSSILKEKYKISQLDALIYSSLFLILPFFRSSAFWGLTENLGWLFLILSIKFYLNYENSTVRKKIFYLFLSVLFSSLAIYTRPYLVFFPLFLILFSFTKRDFFFLKRAIPIYFLLSIPGVILLYIWGGSVYIVDGQDKVDFIQSYHHPRFIFKNLIIFFSLFLFYFLPLVIVESLKKQDYIKKVVKNTMIIFAILLILDYFEIFDYLNEMILGGGAFLKFNKILFKDNLILFLLISSLGLATILHYAQISKKNLILILTLLVFCQPKFILQEYFEPLVLILLFSLFDLGKNNSVVIKENKTIIIFSTYFLIFFLASYTYRYLDLFI